MTAYSSLISVAGLLAGTGIVVLYWKLKPIVADWLVLAWLVGWVVLFWPLLYYCVWRVRVKLTK